MVPEEELLAAEALQQLGNPAKYPVISTPDMSYEPGQLSPSPLCSPVSTASFSSMDRDFSQPPGPRATKQSMIGNMLLTATSILLPRETQQRLRTFVRMLRLANESLNHKIIALKDAMDQESKGIEAELSVSAARQDIVSTIKKSTNLIATVAGNSLPKSARFAIRKMVLSLPSQWRLQQQSADNATQSAVLSLATETLHLIRDVITVVDDTLDRAESWCGKLPGPEANAESNGSASTSTTAMDSSSPTPEATASPVPNSNGIQTIAAATVP